MTVPEFIEAYGDPATWSDEVYEDFFDFATPDPCQEADLLPGFTPYPAA